MFNCNGVDWQIKYIPPYPSTYPYDKNIPYPLKRDDGTYTMGMTDGGTHTIYLDNRLRGRMLEKVLCHELTHAVIMSYGIEIDEDVEELVCNMIAEYGKKIVSLLENILKTILKAKQ